MLLFKCPKYSCFKMGNLSAACPVVICRKQRGRTRWLCLHSVHECKGCWDTHWAETGRWGHGIPLGTDRWIRSHHQYTFRHCDRGWWHTHRCWYYTTCLNQIKKRWSVNHISILDLCICNKVFIKIVPPFWRLNHDKTLQNTPIFISGVFLLSFLIDVFDKDMNSKNQHI